MFFWWKAESFYFLYFLLDCKWKVFGSFSTLFTGSDIMKITSDDWIFMELSWKIFQRSSWTWSWHCCFSWFCSGTCLPLKTAQDSWTLQKILDRLVVEILFTSLYCIMKQKTKFTELKKANSQKQTYQKGELRSKLALLAASWISINGHPSFFLQNVLNDLHKCF